MKVLALPYASVGVVVGSVLNFAVTGGSVQVGDLLTGATLGFAIGVGLAFAKHKILDRR